MKKIAITLFVALLLFPSIAAQESLKVLSFNLRYGEKASMEEIADYIKSEDPDLVSFQEVDWNTSRSLLIYSERVAFINELAQLTGMFGVYGKAIDYQDGYYGVAALSKYPILKSERVLLPNPEPVKEQRVLLVLEVEIPDASQPITFIATHLEATSTDHRLAQIAFINEQLEGYKKPVILAGDLNSRPYNSEITEGFSQWGVASNDDYTYPADAPTIKIDYIFFYPNYAFTVEQMTTDSSVQLSDHLPIWTKLGFNTLIEIN